MGLNDFLNTAFSWIRRFNSMATWSLQPGTYCLYQSRILSKLSWTVVKVFLTSVIACYVECLNALVSSFSYHIGNKTKFSATTYFDGFNKWISFFIMSRLENIATNLQISYLSTRFFILVLSRRFFYLFLNIRGSDVNDINFCCTDFLGSAIWKSSCFFLNGLTRLWVALGVFCPALLQKICYSAGHKF